MDLSCQTFTVLSIYNMRTFNRLSATGLLLFGFIFSFAQTRDQFVTPDKQPLPVLKHFDPAAEKPGALQTGSPELARCDNPINIQCGLPLLNQNNNTGVASQFNYIDYKNGCISSAQTNGWTGPERLYSFTLNEQSSVHIVMDIKTAGVDLDIFLLKDCNPFNCYAFSLETSSHEMVDVNLLPGTYYLLVDGFYSNSIATYDLSLNCTCTCIEDNNKPNGKVLLCDNFQDYKNGISIDAQSTRWNGFGSNSDDAVTEQTGSNLYGRWRGITSGSTIYDPDMNYYLDEKESGRYRISWRMRVENNRLGNFAVLHERSSYSPPPTGNVWAYEVNFNTDGTGILRPGTANGSNDVSFLYPKATWFNVVNIVDLNKDSVELWVNNTFVSKWRFSIGYDAINNTQLADLKRLAAVNFYAPTNYDFAVDDICVWTTISPCTGGTGDAVCTGSGNRYANETAARCALFTSLEFDDCLTVCDYGGTFMYRGDNFNGVLDNSDLAAGFIKNDPCVRSAYGNNMPNPLYADIYIFYKNDNDVFSVNLNTGGNNQVKKFVFSCRSNPGCSVNKQTCLSEVPNTGYIPAACNNTYYIVVTGPAGSTYSLSIIPTGPCGGGAEVLSCGTTITDVCGNVGSNFSKAGGAYNSCYAGSRGYTGGENVYRFDFTGPRRAILTLEPLSPSNAKMGLFLYSFLCGQQCVTYAENSATGGKAILNQSLGEGTYYVIVDSDAGNPSFKLTLDCQLQIDITHYDVSDTDTCTTCGCFNKGQLLDPVVVNDYCACKGVDKTQSHKVLIKAPGSNFSPTDQIQFLYNNQYSEPSQNYLYQRNWFIVPNGSNEPNVSFELFPDNVTDGTLKCAYLNNDNFQLYLTQKVSGQDHLRRLIPTYSTTAGNNASGTFLSGAQSEITRLSLTGDPIHFNSSSRFENPPPVQGSRTIQISTNGPWTMQKTPAPGFTDASWLTVSLPPGAGTGPGTDEITLSYPNYNSPFPRAVLLTFTYSRQTNFKIVVRVEQQGICPNASVVINTTPAVICNGTNVTFSASAGQYNGQSLTDLYNYSWSSGQTTSSFSEVLSANTTRTVTITNKYAFCPNSATNTRTITVGQAPVASISGPTSVCAGGTITLSASGGATYAWSNGSTLNTASVTPTAGNNTYTVTVTNAAGCTNTTTRIITINQPPDAAITPANTVCTGQNISLTASGGGTYLWSTGATTATINPIPAAPSTTYTVTVTGANTCTNTATRQVSVSPAPTISLNAPAAVCSGANAAINASGPVGATFLWSTGATTSGITPALTSATTYTVTVSLGSCTTSTSTTVGIRPTATLSITKADAGCGQPTGSASVTVTSGIGPFLYAWSNNATTAAISNLGAGVYVVTVTDGNACTATTSATIGNSNGPSATAAAPGGQTVCAGRTVDLSAGATGGAQPYSYLWSNGSTNANTSVNPVNTGAYTVTVRDINNCTSVAQVSINVNPAPTPNINGGNAVCAGASINLSGVGGTLYNWSTGATGSAIVLTPVAAQTIGLTVTDANGCTATITRTISINPRPTTAITGNATVCAGDGTVLTASGGVVYAWSSGQNTSVAVLTPGTTTTYTVTVTNDFGCTATATQAVTVNPLPVASISGPNAVCAGAPVALTAGGGTAFFWSNGQSGITINVTPTATTTYSVTVSGNGCLGTATKTVTVNPSPTAGISGNTAICPGAGTVLSAFGGIVYNWNTGANTQNLPVSPSFTTTYTVTVTNEQACTATATATVNVRPAATVSINKTDAACGLPSGTATAQAGGGTGSYTYFWSNGSTSATLFNLSAGFYAVTATDVNNCTATANTTIGNTNGPSVSVSGGQTFCPGGNALLRADINGGTQPYNYSWSNGNTNASISVSPAATTTYSVTVRDANNCTSVSAATVTVNPAPTPSVSGSNAVCTGATATLNAFGGVEFLWSNGATGAGINPVIATATTFTVTVTDVIGCTATATRSVQVLPPPNITINGSNTLCPGSAALLTATGGIVYSWNTGASNPSIPITPSTTTTYTVTATDGNGCTATASKTVSLHPVANISLSKSDAGCGLPTGSVSATVTGAVGTPIYVWSNGATTTSINNLIAGVYNLTVIDGNGCATSASATVGNSNGPTAGAGAGLSICPGRSTNLTGTATGGLQPYTYTWSNGSTGSVISVSPVTNTTYTVTVRDVNGCTSSAQVLVNVLAAPTPAINGSSSVCAGTEIPLTAFGGERYLWSTGATTAEITALITATSVFTVTATDANGCTATATRTVSATSLPSAAIDGPGTVCSGQNITLTATGGTVYIWSTGSTAANISVSPNAGTSYFVTVSNEAGCSAIAAKDVSVNTPPNLTLTPSSAGCGQANGSINLSIAGGGGSYVYNWSNGATTAQLSAVAAGTYSVTVRDANGCSSIGNARVGNSDGPNVNAGADAAVCAGGSVILNAFSNGGTPPYRYQWSTGGLSDAVPVTPSVTTTYTVTVTDGANCTAVDAVTVVVNPLPPLAISGNTVLCGTQSTVLTATGGLGYQWNSGATTNSISVQSPGLYVVTATGANNCMATASLQITQYPGISATINIVNTLRCFGQNTGVLSVTPTGGTSPFGVLWSTGATQPQIGALPAGTYSVIVSDQANCRDTAFVTLAPPPPALILADTTVQNEIGGNGLGSVKVIPGGGVPPYRYVWSLNNFTIPGENQAIIDSLTAGKYSLRLLDANDCAVNFGPFVVDNIVSAKDPAWAAKLLLFPNPTTGRLFLSIDWPESIPVENLSVLDMLGREVLGNTTLHLSNKTSALDLSHCAPGAYLLRIQLRDHTLVRKVWIQR